MTNDMEGAVSANPLGVNRLDRVHVFVDAQNLLGMLRTIQRKLDYKRFLAFLRDNTRLARLSYYVVQRENRDQRSSGVIDMVEYAGYDVYRRNAYELHDSNGYVRVKGSIIGEMTVGMIRAADAGIDHIIVVTGDGDFHAGIEEVKQRGSRVTLISDTSSVADEIRRACDAFINLSDLPDYLFLDS